MFKIKSATLVICVLVFFLNLSLCDMAFAYIDPGAGSALFQLIIAGLAGLLWIVKVYWQKIISFFSRKKNGKKTPPQ
ncbi:MAG TPA: hypothetical protein PLY88_00840 [Candidatus Omnitrophota bacterium]|nr:hypothetical protein [Candidatus Omnitrophota bacterium]